MLRSAGGSSFAGDFMVASRSRDGTLAPGRGRRRLRQGRAGRVPVAAALRRLRRPARRAAGRASFLPAANDYLLRQDWSEGFATAVHVALDLDTGAFELRSAGHPPGVQLHAGSGPLGRARGRGPGARADAATPSSRVVARPASTAATRCCCSPTGWSRRPQRDISLGIDKLLGQGERLLRAGFEQGAHRLIDQLESMNDDRALLLLHRR